MKNAPTFHSSSLRLGPRMRPSAGSLTSAASSTGSSSISILPRPPSGPSTSTIRPRSIPLPPVKDDELSPLPPPFSKFFHQPQMDVTVAQFNTVTRRLNKLDNIRVFYGITQRPVISRPMPLEIEGGNGVTEIPPDTIVSIYNVFKTLESAEENASEVTWLECVIIPDTTVPKTENVFIKFNLGDFRFSVLPVFT